MAELERDSEQGDREGGRRNNSHDETSVLRSHHKRTGQSGCLSTANAAMGLPTHQRMDHDPMGPCEPMRVSVPDLAGYSVQPAIMEG